MRAMRLPVCCGSEMTSVTELGRFVEAVCDSCGDVVYVKVGSRIPDLAVRSAAELDYE